MSGIYVRLSLSNESEKLLFDFCEEHLTPLKLIDSKHYHVTLAYSKEGFDYNDKNYLKTTIVTPEHWSVFGEEEKVLVLEVFSKELFERFIELKKQGYRSKYDYYRPHITIAAVSEHFSTDSIPVPKFTLELINEQWETLDDNYKYEPKKLTIKETLEKIFKGLL